MPSDIAIAARRRAPVWLVEIDAGDTLRIATQDVILPQRYFTGAVIEMGEIGAAFSWDNFSYSQASITVTVANVPLLYGKRLSDIERHITLEGADCRVYAWFPGLEWTDISTHGLVARGVFRKSTQTTAGCQTYTFSIDPHGSSAWKQLCSDSINSETWPNHRTDGGGGSAAGAGYPVLFGTHESGLKMDCIDTVAYKYMVAGGQFSPESFGPEMSTNCYLSEWTGDDPDDWSVVNEDANNYVTEHTAGMQMVSNDTASLYIYRGITVSQGESYRVSVRVSNYSSGDVRMTIFDHSNSADILSGTNMGWTANGSYTYDFVAPSGCSLILLYISRSGSMDLVYSYISVKALTAGVDNITDKDGAAIASGWSATNTLDGQGMPCTIVDFTADQTANEPMTAGAGGVIDGAGIYTGVDGGLIDHPADIFHYLVDNYSTLGRSWADTTSIKTARSLMPQLRFAASCMSLSSAGDWADRILYQCCLAKAERVGGLMGLVTFDLDAPATLLIDTQTQAVGEITLSKTDADMIVNDLRVDYHYLPGPGTYSESLVRDRTNSKACLDSWREYGAMETTTLELPDAPTEMQAGILASRYLDFFATCRDTIEVLDLPYEYGWDLRRGDCAEITIPSAPSVDGEGWSGERCLLIEKYFLKDVMRTTWLKI